MRTLFPYTTLFRSQTSAGAGTRPIPTDRLWGAALTLILMIAVINIGARVIAKTFAPRKS